MSASEVLVGTSIVSGGRFGEVLVRVASPLGFDVGLKSKQSEQMCVV